MPGRQVSARVPRPRQNRPHQRRRQDRTRPVNYRRRRTSRACTFAQLTSTYFDHVRLPSNELNAYHPSSRLAYVPESWVKR